MKMINFIPKKYIDEYFNRTINIDIYEEITSDKNWQDTFKPLDFFNLLYEEFEILLANKNKPHAVVQHLLELDLNKEKRSLLFQYLLRLIFNHQDYETEHYGPEEKQFLFRCHRFLETKLKEIEVKPFPLSKNDRRFIERFPELFSEDIENNVTIGAWPPPTIEMKPVLKPESVQIVFNIVKDFFNTEQQIELKLILETGNNASIKLLFKDNGNRLTDTFKKLIEHDFITGCQKQDLINWIIANFTFLHRKTETEFKPDTVEKTISRNLYPCKSPLIEIKNGQIQKVDQPHVRNQNKY
jgi:hypothetical protein